MNGIHQPRYLPKLKVTKVATTTNLNLFNYQSLSQHLKLNFLAVATLSIYLALLPKLGLAQPTLRVLPPNTNPSGQPNNPPQINSESQPDNSPVPLINNGLENPPNSQLTEPTNLPPSNPESQPNNPISTPTPIPINQPVSPQSSDPNLLQLLRGSPLEYRHPSLGTAHQLWSGEVITILRYRQSFPPKDVASGITGQPTLGFTWGINDNLELTFDAQTVDNEGPGKQGNFRALRTTSTGSGNFFQELTLQAKQRLWQNSSGTQALSGIVSLSRGVRSYRISTLTGQIPQGNDNDSNKQELVPTLELPFTISSGNKLQFTISPKVAFLPSDNALYFRTLPISNPGKFGTTLGLAGGISYRPSSRITLWGDAFVPFTGNNTINRDTGLPAKTVVYNAGIRYIVNPRLSTDLFISNSLGNTGALSIVGDREYPFVGFGVTYLPGITQANRRYATSFKGESITRPTPAGLAFLDGGTLPSGQLLTTIQGGGQGLLGSIQFGLMDDFQIGTFIDLIPGTVDESEFGFNGKIRFLNQADGDPFTFSIAATLARGNNVLINLVENNRNEFEERGLKKGGFAFANEGVGELFIYTISTPIHYEFKSGTALWLTPTLGFVQRNGLQIGGINFGGSTPITNNLELVAEAGLDFSGKGNTFIGDTRKTIIPWNVGVRWSPFSQDNNSGLQLEAYLTNRLGSTPFQNLRVQADNPLTFGVGMRLPIDF
ncbi:hypothetical protein [Merismopedia glauca]|uniref:Uncharacterized protein n=1 Tax=Merismopedia glauca CCAP 1448/3 TaxID=1296344 RepID=A0A2T1CA53_9CYAN|nr:hypothetical protein [Merismopedia glauca]PSB05013.1 hypothetical protein C7B64_01230 [Merismopedia glauca CCAP 1448/3]